MPPNDRDRRIADNLRLVHACANRFRGKGIDYDDLFSAGCIGLCKAADGFQPERGFAFSTYAVPVILGEIRRLFRAGGSVKVSRTLQERAQKAQRLREELARSLGREPRLSELAEAFGVADCEMAQLLAVSQPTVSLTAPEAEGAGQLDIPVDSGEDAIQNAIALREVLKALPETDRRLIELRYFEGLTQVRTAERLGLTQVQVSRRERAVLLEMRKRLTG
ncbi:MAG TPA: sigma-70 family RNA polymerase sigma factor [Candidatus Fimenecus excrementigallinarum]|uniref:Sigma-70 family RNA polymerase sigma factor n=1 Tax=Candidatus Fimenecus excrementigallinarum TaxID=2840816 RepID=A0A9D1IEI2_9FIRM|nr:sigma-70 family RNA polymerase sigma factor [Candidatus Fimenecus excrementigallinarum]